MPVTRLKQKEQRTGFRQPGCDRSMILASAARSTRTDASVTIRPRIPTPSQRVSRICAGTDVLAASFEQFENPEAPAVRREAEEDWSR